MCKIGEIVLGYFVLWCGTELGIHFCQKERKRCEVFLPIGTQVVLSEKPGIEYFPDCNILPVRLELTHWAGRSWLFSSRSPIVFHFIQNYMLRLASCPNHPFLSDQRPHEQSKNLA